MGLCPYVPCEGARAPAPSTGNPATRRIPDPAALTSVVTPPRARSRPRCSCRRGGLERCRRFLFREFRIRRSAVAGAGDRAAEVRERWPNPQQGTARSREDMMIALRLGRSKPLLRAPTASFRSRPFLCSTSIGQLDASSWAPPRASHRVVAKDFHGAAEDLIELMQGR
jgi:hypothetical protein